MLTSPPNASNNQRKVISVDVDDVLAYGAKEFIEFSNAQWSLDLSIEHYTEDWSNLWQVDHDEVRRRAKLFYDTRLADYQPLDAYDVLSQLSQNYDLLVVTSRPTMLKGITLGWLQKYFAGIFLEDKIYFSGMWDTLDETSLHKDKGSLLKKLGADYHIDDQPKHCIGAHQHGIVPLLFGDYSWNRSALVPEGTVRVTDWQAVLEFFNEQSSQLS